MRSAIVVFVFVVSINFLWNMALFSGRDVLIAFALGIFAVFAIRRIRAARDQ